MDDERLKNGRFFGKDYFRELLERVRSIRASERRIYQQITDIFAECSIDYDPKSRNHAGCFTPMCGTSSILRLPAIRRQKSLRLNADASKPLMGMSTYKTRRWPRPETDAAVAKLSERSRNQKTDLFRLFSTTSRASSSGAIPLRWKALPKA